jgi:porin
LIGGSWSDKLFKANQQDPRLLLGFLNLPGAVPPRTVSGSWSAYHNFDQFLYTMPGKPDQGFGIFGRIGVADRKASPIEQFYSFGLGGQGLLDGPISWPPSGAAADRTGVAPRPARARDLRVDGP